MKYKYLLADADETLFDFKSAERESLIWAINSLGHKCSNEEVSQYSKINDRLWKLFEKGEIEKKQIFEERFKTFLSYIEINADPLEVNQIYLAHIADCSKLLDGAEEFVCGISKNMTVAIITNGSSYAQKKRFKCSPISQYVKSLYVSEDIGAAKPNIKYFESVLNDLKISDKSEAIILGDSLSSDILGGNNAGIDTCWYNPQHKANPTCAAPTYTISKYEEFYEISRSLGDTMK